jgi:riboflavin kinase/FMN adenylyltransferase
MRIHLSGELAPPPEGRPVVSIGNFDGVHRGHRAILDETVRVARSLGAPAGAITFDPHPIRILAPAKAPARLSSAGSRGAEIARAGIDDLWIVPFTHELSLTEPGRFVRDLLVGRLNVRGVVIGDSFCFGRDRLGDLALLRLLGASHGFEAHGVAPVEWEGSPISSSRIRRALASGDVDATREMLGRPFALDGVVAPGAGIGRKLGFPTVNLRPEAEALPADGVYVTRTTIFGRGERIRSVTNVGHRPTLNEAPSPVVETFLLDFSGDLYGERVEVELLARLRPERRFDGEEELVRQIALDVEAARKWFRREEGGA